MNYVFDSTDFKRYLVDCSTKYRVDGLSVWVNAIPLPVDLFDQMFDDSLNYFRVYLDHIVGGMLLKQALDKNLMQGVSFYDFPSTSIVQNNEADLKSNLMAVLKDDFSIYNDFATDVSEFLGIEDYQIQISSLIKALSHQGKKYSRIYCPSEIKDKIRKIYPDFLSEFAKSNGDMFGNIIADSLGIYRSGFNDALANLFNKLLDFKICECSGVLASRSKITLVTYSNDENSQVASKFISEKTTDGSLWEPYFDGEYKVKLNPVHPYAKKLQIYSEQSKDFYELLLKLAEYEAQLSDDKDLKSIESMRSIISRTLWIESDA